jgi:transcription elongation factor Elf1
MSLVTTPTSRLASCRSCGSHRVTSLSMTLTDGSRVDFASCHRCENKTWSDAGRQLAFANVLERTRKHR